MNSKRKNKNSAKAVQGHTEKNMGLYGGRDSGEAPALNWSEARKLAFNKRERAKFIYSR